MKSRLLCLGVISCVLGSAARAEVMELRLGINGGSAATPAQVAKTLGFDENLVRTLEAEAWVRIQSPRSYDAVLGERNAS